MNKKNKISVRYIYILFTAVLLYSCNDNKTKIDQPSEVIKLPVYVVKRQNTVTWREFPVTLEGHTDVEIRSLVDGYLQAIFVDEGAYVTAGQKIFKVEDHRYREALNNANGMLNVAEAALINARLEIEKIEPLVQDKVVSSYQLKSAQAALKIAQGNKKQAEAAVAAAKINLDYTTITAPVSGYITRLPKKQGSLVSISDAEPLTALSNNSKVYAYFTMSESDFFSFREKNPDATHLKSLPPIKLLLPNNLEYEQSGRIDMIDGKVNRATGAITFRASFPNSKGMLRSGNTGKVKMNILQNDVFLIPQLSTMEEQSKIYVFAVDKKNKVKKTPLNVIAKTDSFYLIKEGLETGDRIVYSGFGNLKNGTIISIGKTVK